MKLIIYAVIACLIGIKSGYGSEIKMQNPCQKSEEWDFVGKMDKYAMKEFHKLLDGQLSPIRSFGEAMDYHKRSVQFNNSVVEKRISEYWIGRSFFAAKLYHLAFDSFTILLKNSEDSTIQDAAMGCMQEIQNRYPSFQASKSALSQATIEINKQNYSDAIVALEAFIEKHRTHSAKLIDPAHLLLARAYYSTAQYSKAITHFLAVRKSSNELVAALTGLSWSYLMEGKYEEAVGVAMQLKAGGLKNTFAPEADMISAMAFNELCQFPASIVALQSFRAQYGPIYQWLKTNTQTTGLYPLVVGVLQGQATVPAKISSEWIRSPLFLSRQEEINLILGYANVNKKLVADAAEEQRLFLKDLLLKMHEFIHQYQVAKRQLKPGQKLSDATLSQFQTIRLHLHQYMRFVRAAKPWRAIVARAAPKTEVIKNTLVRAIDADVSEQNHTMLAMLEQIAENNQMIETEIYTGASQDMIWKNAHPDYAAVINNMHLGRGPGADTARTWDWGRVKSGSLDSDEMWEDELGAARADLTDNCSNKEKYMKLKGKKS